MVGAPGLLRERAKLRLRVRFRRPALDRRFKDHYPISALVLTVDRSDIAPSGRWPSRVLSGQRGAGKARLRNEPGAPFSASTTEAYRKTAGRADTVSDPLKRQRPASGIRRRPLNAKRSGASGDHIACKSSAEVLPRLGSRRSS